MSTIYGWLSPLSKEFSSKQHDTFIITPRQDRLSDRVLQSEDYQEWLHGVGKTLWCLGIRMFIPDLTHQSFKSPVRIVSCAYESFTGKDVSIRHRFALISLSDYL